jgi:hypothetical protein
LCSLHGLTRQFCEVFAGVLPIGAEQLAFASEANSVSKRSGWPGVCPEVVKSWRGQTVRKTIGIIQAGMVSKEISGKIIPALGSHPLLAQIEPKALEEG